MLLMVIPKETLATCHAPRATEKKATPFFSIIIPVYNVAPYLRECLDSILAQSFTDWECLCVDDGSTDESGAILDEYAKKDARFRVFHQENRGVSAARNLALDQMRGVWFWCVDGDDAIRVDALMWLSETIKEYAALDSIAFHACMGDDLKAVPWLPLPDVKTLTPSDKATANALATHRQGAWSTVQRRCTLRFEPYVIGEDALFQVLAFWENRQKIVTDAPLYFYRTRVDSATRGTPSLQKVHDLLETEKRILQSLIDHTDQWQADEMVPFLRWKRNFVWFTFQKMFYRLPAKDLKTLIPLWCQIQTLQFSLYPENGWRRGVWQIINATQSPLACKMFIYWPKCAQEVVKNILRCLGLLALFKANA